MAALLDAVREEIRAHETYLSKLREIEAIAADLYAQSPPPCRV